MSKLSSASPERLQRLRADASAMFGPILLREALRRLVATHGSACLDGYEVSMTDRIEAERNGVPDLADLKELAVEQLFDAVKEVRAHPDGARPPESASDCPQDAATLEEQLQSGLEGTFPASDPPAVVSPAIPGGAGEQPTGVEEHLRQRALAKRTA